MNRIRLMCVDDERNVLRALGRVFRGDRFEMTFALSGPEGLKMLEAGPTPDVILADYRMPGMSGVEFLQKVYERWPNTLRIILSGYAEATAVDEALRDGKVFRFFHKPWNDEELINAIVGFFEHPVCLLNWKHKSAAPEAAS